MKVRNDYLTIAAVIMLCFYLTAVDIKLVSQMLAGEFWPGITFLLLNGITGLYFLEMMKTYQSK